jgi:hypothetical protein
MRKIGVAGLAAALAVGVLAQTRPASACGGYRGPGPEVRFALADCVLVGKVSLIEARKVSAALPGSNGRLGDFTIAVIKVQEMLKGDDRLTHVRVGLLPHQIQALPLGYEACFFLHEHEQETFLVMAASNWADSPINKAGNPRFTAEVDSFRRLGKLLINPVASLRSANADDRLLTAALLVAQYRTFQPAIHDPTRTEPMDPQLSFLILKTLSEVDWKHQVAGFRVTPWQVFNDLGLTARDGWNPPAFADMNAREMFTREWVHDHAGQVRIVSFVRR